MATNRKVSKAFITVLAFGWLTRITFPDTLNAESRAKYEKNITVTARALKGVYDPNEPVPLMLAIANHGSEPVYLSTDQPEIFDGYVRVRDSDGAEIMGEPIPTPPPPPIHYYMVKGGNRIFTVPLSKIDGAGVMISLMADALKIYHNHISPGIYELDPGVIEIIHEVGPLIVREDVPHRLWVEPQSPMVRVRHKLNTIKVEIQKRRETPEPIAQARPFAWATFFAGSMSGVGALCLILLLRRKGISRTK